MNEKMNSYWGTIVNVWRSKVKKWLVKPHHAAKAGKLTAAQWTMTLPCLIGFASATTFTSVYLKDKPGALAASLLAVIGISLWLWMWLMAWQDNRAQKADRQMRQRRSQQ